MSIPKFIQKVTVQTAVYWGNPVDDHFGGSTFDDPIELTPPTNGVRWEDRQKIITSKDGKEIVVDVAVLVNQDLDIGGWLYLGLLTDLEDSSYVLESGQNYPYPSQVEGAYEIVSFEKIPLIKSTTQFVRTAFLTKQYFAT